jgi:hypothetical protein
VWTGRAIVSTFCRQKKGHKPLNKRSGGQSGQPHTLTNVACVLSVEFVPEPEWTLRVLRRRVLGHDMLDFFTARPFRAILDGSPD